MFSDLVETFIVVLQKQYLSYLVNVDDVAEFYGTQRQAAKAVTFGIMYGAGPSKISQQVTKDSGKYFSVSEAKDVIGDYFGSFHRLKKWIETNKKFIIQNGFVYSFLDASDDYPTYYLKMLAFVVILFGLGLIFWFSLLLQTLILLGAIDTHKTIKHKDEVSYFCPSA